MPNQMPSVPPQTKCQNCPLRTLEIFRPFSEEEVKFISTFKSGEIVVDAGTTVLSQGHNSAHIYTMLSGWGFRYKMLDDGRRQILNFVLPGDIIGLQSVMFNEMQHSVEMLTNGVLCIFQRDQLWKLYENHASLAYDVTWLACRSERMLDDQLLNVGRRSALERVAWVMLYLFDRARELKLNDGFRLKLPVTQTHIADALGLSLVHTNKTIQALTRRGLIQWKDGMLRIVKIDALNELAGFDLEHHMQRPLI